MVTPSTAGSRKECRGQINQFHPFNDAVKYVHVLQLGDLKEWQAWCKSGMRPPSIPSNPDKTYEDAGWQGYRYWLGTGCRTNHQAAGTKLPFLPFKEALVYARSLKLKTQKEWVAWRNSGARPANVPTNPARTYKHDGWQGCGHWLGTSNLPARLLPARLVCA